LKATEKFTISDKKTDQSVVMTKLKKSKDKACASQQDRRICSHLCTGNLLYYGNSVFLNNKIQIQRIYLPSYRIIVHPLTLITKMIV
jgi:hypothetical protein